MELGHFAVTQPTLEDIYLELTGSPTPAQPVAERCRGGDSMSSAVLKRLAAARPRSVGWQIRYEQRAYWRNRGRGIFTFVFPLMFLVIFASLNSGAHLSSLGGIPLQRLLRPGDPRLRDHRHHVREHGDLDRDPPRRGRPQADAGHAAAARGRTSRARIGSTVVIVGADDGGACSASACSPTASTIQASTLPGLIVVLVLGTAAFTTLGIGITRFIPNAESAPVFVNLSVLPLTFISSIWFPTDGMPKWLHDDRQAVPDPAAGRRACSTRSTRARRAPGFNGQPIRSARDLDRDRGRADAPVPAPAAGRGHVNRFFAWLRGGQPFRPEDPRGGGWPRLDNRPMTGARRVGLR